MVTETRGWETVGKGAANIPSIPSRGGGCGQEPRSIGTRIGPLSVVRIPARFCLSTVFVQRPQPPGFGLATKKEEEKRGCTRVLGTTPHSFQGPGAPCPVQAPPRLTCSSKEHPDPTGSKTSNVSGSSSAC